MESWFATLKKKKLYQLDTTKLTVEQVKTLVWRYTFAYYNTKRLTTVNPDGLPPVADIGEAVIPAKANKQLADWRTKAKETQLNHYIRLSAEVTY